jgi:hypothetical protein
MNASARLAIEAAADDRPQRRKPPSSKSGGSWLSGELTKHVEAKAGAEWRLCPQYKFILTEAAESFPVSPSL